MSHKSMSAAFESLFHIKPFKKAQSLNAQRKAATCINPEGEIANAKMYREARERNRTIEGKSVVLGNDA